MTVMNNILFWASVLVCVFTLYRRYISKDELQQKEFVISEKVYRFCLVAAFALAVFIRVWQFGSVPGGFNQDGAMAAVDGKALAEYGTDRYGMWMPVHLTAWGYGQMSALLSYLIAIPVKVFGLSPVTARIPQLLASLAALWCLYGFMRDTFSKEAALITTAFAAINPWHILQSRWALDCNLYPQFFVMGICFLNKSVQKDKTRHLVISMVMFGLCMYCYGVSIYTMPVFLLTACIYLLVKKKITWKKAILALLVWLLISWPFILTMAINFLKLDTIQTPFFTIPYFKDSIRSNDILFFSDQFFAQLKNNFQSLMNTTLLQRKDLPWNDVEGFGTMYLFSMPFVMTGIFALMKEYRKSAGAVFAVFFLLTGVWCGLVTNGVNVNRINIIYFPMIVMGGLGIYTVIVTCRHIKWGILGVYAISFVMFTATYFTTYADMIEYYFFQDFGKAVTSLKDSEAKKLYINIEDAPNLSEILTLFYHDIDAHYYQGNMQGNEIPFQEKYIFDCIENIEIDPLEDAQYVVKDMEIELFDASLFEFKQFGDFYVVTPRFKISADDSV